MTLSKKMMDYTNAVVELEHKYSALENLFYIIAEETRELNHENEEYGAGQVGLDLDTIIYEIMNACAEVTEAQNEVNKAGQAEGFLDEFEHMPEEEWKKTLNIMRKLRA